MAGMGRQNRIYGLMAGITIGFAVWGGTGVGTGGQAAPAASEQTVQEGSAAETNIAVPETLEDREPADRKTADREPADGEAAKPAQSSPLTLHAQSAVLMDGDTGRILYEKNGGQFRPMASTTKIMTCILALELGDGEAVCTVSSEAASQPKVHLGAPKDTKFYLKDLLYSLMLESHNDSAVMIAERIGGSVEGFAKLMNEKARTLGCEDTWFLTPNGLDAAVTEADGTVRTHGTTARDLAAIMRYCVTQSPKREEFLEVTRTSNYSFTDLSGKRSYSCVNHNALLQMMEGALSGKTGFTGGAGYSYVGALTDSGRTYILALLGCGWPPHKTYKWADARALFSYGKETYHYHTVREDGEAVSVPVTGGVAGDWREQAARGEAFLYSQATVTAREQVSEAEREFQVLMAEDEKLERRTELPDHLPAPVNQGDLVGTVTYSLDGLVIKTYPLYASHSVEKQQWFHCMEQIRALFFLPAP